MTETGNDIATTDGSVFKIKGMLVERGDGTTEKTKMFDIFELPLDDYSDLEFSLEEVRRMRMHVMKMRTGITTLAAVLVRRLAASGRPVG